MRKFIMPIMAAAFLAIAGTAAMPQTANAGSVSVGIHGHGWGVHFNDRDNHRARGHRRHGRRAHNFRRHCEPVFRKKVVWTHHGWKKIKVKVGYDCHRHRHRNWR